jgi:hypothetical protein
MTTLTTARRRLVTVLACAAAVTTLAARPADAQFKKLKDLGKAAVKGAVEGTAEGATKKAIGDGSKEAKPGTVKFTENLLEITDARIAQFIKGFDAEIAARPAAEKRHKEAGAAYEAAAKGYEASLAKYDRDQAAYEKRNAAYRACADKINEKYEKASQKDIAASEKAKEKVEGELTEDKEKKLQAMADRMKAAQARGDQVAMRAIADSVMREMAGVMSAAMGGNEAGQRIVARSKEMEAELKTCPQPGEPPKRPDMPNSVDADAGREITEAAATKASGLTAAQYGLMKERIETYVQYKGRTGNTQYIFTAAELEALSKQLEELQKRPDLVQPSYWYPGKEK